VVLFGRRTRLIVGDGCPAAHILTMTTTIHAPATTCPTPSQAPATPRPLLDHQVPAVADAVNGLADTARGQVIMACGTGKTVVAQRITEALAGSSTDTVLVLFPNLGLLSQNARAWAIYREAEFTALALCSEQQVGRGRARDSDEIQLDPAEFGIPSTTDPGVLADWLRNTPGRRVVFATYQSSDKLTAMHTAHPELGGWSMIVCDEAHRTAGPGWSATGMFSTVLDDTRVPARRRLFLTATPRLHRGRRSSGREHIEVVSMDDDALFGPRLHELSFAAAAEAKVLARYRLVIIGVDDAAINTLIRSNTRLDGLHNLDARKAATLVAVNRAAKQYGLHRILAYHNTIQHSREFARNLALVESVLPHEHKPAGPLGVRHVDGAMSPARREEALGVLTDTGDTNGEWTVVSNVKCLAEGVDVPTLDGIVVCEPRSSAVDVVQMVGRAIRPNTARDEPSVILLPVYLAPGEDPAQVVARSDFSGVVQTMTAMRDMDETLDAHFTDAAEPWEVTYQKVAAHTTETGPLPSPNDVDPDTARLGRWCIRQAVAVDLDTTTPPGKRRLTGPQTAKVLALPGFAAVDTTDVDWTGHRRTDTDGRPPIDFDLPDGVGGQVAARLAEAIHLHVVEALTDGYHTGLAYLRVFAARAGHANVPNGMVIASLRAQDTRSVSVRMSATRSSVAAPAWEAPSRVPHPRIRRSTSARANPSVLAHRASMRCAASAVLGVPTNTQCPGHCPRPTRPRIWCIWAKPKRSAPVMTMTVAAGTFTPTSMTVVATRTSISPAVNAAITAVRSTAACLPWATPMRNPRSAPWLRAAAVFSAAAAVLVSESDTIGHTTKA